MSRKDLTRRAASVLAASDDDDLKAVAQTVFAQFTPATPRQTYGGAELAVAGAALLMQMADLAYTAWSAGRASRGDASPDPLPPPANDQKTSSAEGGSSESGSALTNAQISALMRALIGSLAELQKNELGVAEPDGAADEESGDDNAAR